MRPPANSPGDMKAAGHSAHCGRLQHIGSLEVNLELVGTLSGGPGPSIAIVISGEGNHRTSSRRKFAGFDVGLLICSELPRVAGLCKG